jgi:Uma2 family endonuclease
MSPEEYLAFERAGEAKHEFYDGQVFAMAGTSLNHARVAKNILKRVDSQSASTGCEAFSGDIRVKVNAQGFYTYPDIVTVCGAPELEDDVLDTLLNPKVIFEVLSPSTEAYDRGSKFALYQGLDTLTDYILVAQDRCRVEHFEREDAGHWRLSVYDSIEQSLNVRSIGCEIPLSAIFDRVEFGPPPPLRPQTEAPARSVEA